MEDAAWAFFEPFLFAVRGRGGWSASDHRQVLDAIFRIARTGSPLRDLPEESGKWSSVYRQFWRWTLSGLWELVLNALNDGEVSPGLVQMIDSTIIRAHHLAAGAKGGLKRKVLAAQNLWASPHFTTKIHLIANAHGLPVRAEISGGDVSDFEGFDALLHDDLAEAKVFIADRADRAYDSDLIRRIIEKRGGAPVIPGKINRKKNQSSSMQSLTR